MTAENWTAVAAIAASATAIVTVFYAYFTLRLVWAQLDAKVILSVRHDQSRPTAITLVVENIGRDIAQDVQFFPSRPIPEKAFGMPGREIKPANEMRTGPLVSGISSLAPGDRRLVLWGQYAGLKKALGSGPIVVKFTYRSGKRRFFLGDRTFISQTTLEIDSFAQTDASEPPVVTAINQLRRIANALEKEQSPTVDSGDDVFFGDKID